MQRKDLTIVEMPRRKPRKAPKRSFKRSKPKKRTKSAIWSLKKADKHFSEFIRERDGKCLHPIGCNRSDLQNSHYIGRATKATRFDPDNCIALCWLHHYKDKQLGFEYQKQTVEKHGFDGQYTLWMKNWLGEDRFNALLERSKQSIKQKQAIQDYQNSLNNVTKEI